MAGIDPRRPLFWWLLGSFLGIIAAMSFAEDTFAAVRPLVLGATILLFGIAGEVLFRPRTRWSGPENPPTEARSPSAVAPNGLIEIVRIAIGKVEANRVDGRYGHCAGRLVPPPNGLGSRPSARSDRLWGRVTIATVFMGSEHRPWSDLEIARCLRSVERSCRWIERQAMRWNAAVKLEIASAYFALPLEEFVEPEIGLADEAHDIGLVAHGEWEWILKGLNRGVTKLGCRSFVDFVESAEASVESSSAMVWLVFPRQAGRSFALPRDEALTGGANLAVCYALDSNFPEPLRGSSPRVDPTTIAHEFLHLFHASDKYGRKLDDFRAGTVTRCDIMRMSTGRGFESHRIDLATAREIGWV